MGYWGGYISKILYVKTKESGPLGAWAGHSPLDPPMQYSIYLIADFRSAKWSFGSFRVEFWSVKIYQKTGFFSNLYTVTCQVQHKMSQKWVEEICEECEVFSAAQMLCLVVLIFLSQVNAKIETEASYWDCVQLF